MAGMFFFLRWQSDRFDPTAPALLNESAQLFSQGLLSRKRTLEILRDTLEKTPRLDEQERRDLLQSTSARIPHLLINGWVDPRGKFTGWTFPSSLSSAETDRLIQEAMKRSRWNRFWGRPSTLAVISKRGRSLLVFVQPLRMPPAGRILISTVDPAGLLADLVPAGSQRRLPLQVLLEGRVLYRSSDWVERPDKAGRTRLQRTVSFDGITWLMESRAKEIPRMPSPWPRWTLLAIGLLGSLAVFGMLWATGRLRHLATTDELTALYNRRFFLERWNEEVARAKRYRRNLSCLVIDVNGFKQINDQAGHLMGDLVLRQVANGLRKQLRKTDLLARFGGDEFVVALPETEMVQASRVAEKIRGLDFNQEEALARARVGPVSLSVGVAQLQENDSPLTVIERADQDLYASRRGAPVSKVMEWTPAESTFR